MPLPQKKYYTAENFYALPDDIHAELINGELICLAAPSRLHQEISRELLFTITGYLKRKGGKCRVFAAPFHVQLKESEHTVLEPDISVICDTDKLTAYGCIGAPDWIIEITSPSNPSHDYITKLNLYNAAGVREYWIVEPQNKTVYVYDLGSGKLPLKAYSFHDTIKAGIYEDLSINFAELDFGDS